MFFRFHLILFLLVFFAKYLKNQKKIFILFEMFFSYLDNQTFLSRFSTRSDSIFKSLLPDNKEAKLKHLDQNHLHAPDVHGQRRKSDGLIETGKPRLGQITQIKIVIKESAEFKVRLF